jgi:hypothetical protein
MELGRMPVIAPSPLGDPTNWRDQCCNRKAGQILAGNLVRITLAALQLPNRYELAGC